MARSLYSLMLPAQDHKQLVSALRDVAHSCSLGNKQLRIWVAGCATGESAYCLAVIVYEYLEAHNMQLDVRILASDARQSCLATARRGIYRAFT